jgi:hypothetical protein
MVEVALAEIGIIAFLLVVHFALIGVMRGQSREHSRRQDLLLNQLFHAVKNPWMPAPANDEPVEEERPALYAVSPEQFPDDFNWEE